MVQDFSKERLAFLFLLSNSMKKDFDFLKTKATLSFDTSQVGYLWTQRHLPNNDIFVCTAVPNPKL